MKSLQASAVQQPAACQVDGWPINIATQGQAVSAAVDAATRGQGFTLFTLNLDHLVQLRSDAHFREAYRDATFVTADGAPIVMMCRLLGHRLERVTGADLVVPLAQAAADAQLPVYLFGSSSDVLARVGRELVERTDGKLAIAGTEAPPLNFDPTGPEAREAIARIRASGARLCFVALGAPKQERFSVLAQSMGVKVGFACVGAALDFLVGQQVRAPDFFQRHGLEWAWRLLLEPRRLAKRYFRCAVLFAGLLVRLPLQLRSGGSRA